MTQLAGVSADPIEHLHGAIDRREIGVHHGEHAAIVEREAREAHAVAQRHAALERRERRHHPAVGVQDVGEAGQRLRLALGVVASCACASAASCAGGEAGASPRANSRLPRR